MDIKKIKCSEFLKSYKNFLLGILAIGIIFFGNAINVSAKTLDDDTKDIKANEYTLTIEERDGLQEEINGRDIGLNYNLDTTKTISYDEVMLNECLNKLSCVNVTIIEPQNAKIEFKDNAYVLTNEVYGNRIKRDVFYNSVVKAILNGDKTINLESVGCYANPKIIANSPKISYAYETLNKYISANITYNFAGNVQVVDASVIKDWIWLDENFQVVFDETKVQEYIDAMAYKYSSLLGTSIRVSGGNDGNNHSWMIDVPEETKALIDNIKNGQILDKHPIYKQTDVGSYFDNVGDTFVEIDMANQHLWYYKNGYLVVDGDVVTGNVDGGSATPAGVYNLYFKEKDSVLRGPGYAAPVCFWMPFNGQIGLHDASWRSEFGGTIYKTNGSHGCINAPYYVAKGVYDNIHSGDPIICYN